MLKITKIEDIPGLHEESYVTQVELENGRKFTYFDLIDLLDKGYNPTLVYNDEGKLVNFDSVDEIVEAKARGEQHYIALAKVDGEYYMLHVNAPGEGEGLAKILVTDLEGNKLFDTIEAEFEEELPDYLVAVSEESDDENIGKWHFTKTEKYGIIFAMEGNFLTKDGKKLFGDYKALGRLGVDFEIIEEDGEVYLIDYKIDDKLHVREIDVNGNIIKEAEAAYGEQLQALREEFGVDNLF